jgi:uncharacterized membrane protein (UPF0127 family)
MPSLSPRKPFLQPSAILVALLLACGPDQPNATVHRADGSTARVTLEVVDTPAGLERGLMYRQSMPEDHGMLFVFPDDVVRSFWMKNTLIPLDMLFIAADGRIVGIHADAVPLTTTPRSVGRPSRYVIETNGGWAARHGVQAGDRVEFHGVAGVS